MGIDAARRAIESAIAAFALIVDARDEDAAAFDEHRGFSRLCVTTERRSLFIPLRGIRARVRP